MSGKKSDEPLGLKRGFLIYLSKQIENFKFNKDNGVFTCPSCKKEMPSALYIIGNKIFCQACNYKASMVEIVRLLEPEKTQDWTLADFAKYLKESYRVILPEIDFNFYLDSYLHFKFDLVPLVKNQKTPFENDWLNKLHIDRAEWAKWVESGWNLGAKTGKKSNITVIDIDTKEIPDVFKGITTMIQTTNKGFHYVFAYEEDLPSTRLETLKIDILNDGRQFVLYPSKFDNIQRAWNYTHIDFEIPKMPKVVKDFILANLNKGAGDKKDNSGDKKIVSDSKDENLGDIGSITEGNRNNAMIKVGGILRKKLNSDQTKYVMNFFNKNFVKPPLSDREMYALMGTLDKYVSGDEKDLAVKILEYLRYAEEGTARDIKDAMNEPKTAVDKAISFLQKEQYIVRRGRMFHVVKKMAWRDDFPTLHNEVPFKVPYFDDVCTSNWGDMHIYGGMPGYGKTTISMNILKRLVVQGIKPYYICLETGSRFIKTACSLGMKEGDFHHVIEPDPTKIQVEKNSVTILDWLLIKDKSQTDSVLQYFSEQLVRSNAFLIILMQLKKSEDWFAPNMVDQFPAFATRYLYEKDANGNANGLRGYWQIDKIREPKRHAKTGQIPCMYSPEDKTLTRIDEVTPKDEGFLVT